MGVFFAPSSYLKAASDWGPIIIFVAHLDLSKIYYKDSVSLLYRSGKTVFCCFSYAFSCLVVSFWSHFPCALVQFWCNWCLTQGYLPILERMLVLLHLKYFSRQQLHQGGIPQSNKLLNGRLATCTDRCRRYSLLQKIVAGCKKTAISTQHYTVTLRQI